MPQPSDQLSRRPRYLATAWGRDLPPYPLPPAIALLLIIELYERGGSYLVDPRPNRRTRSAISQLLSELFPQCHHTFLQGGSAAARLLERDGWVERGHTHPTRGSEHKAVTAIKLVRTPDATTISKRREMRTLLFADFAGGPDAATVTPDEGGAFRDVLERYARLEQRHERLRAAWEAQHRRILELDTELANLRAQLPSSQQTQPEQNP